MEKEEPPPKKQKLMDNASQDDFLSDVKKELHISDVDSEDEQPASQELSSGSLKQEQHSSTSVASRDEEESPSSSPEVPHPNGYTLEDLTPKKPSIALPPVKFSPDHFVCYKFPWDENTQFKPFPEKCNYDADFKNCAPLPYHSKLKRTRNGDKVTHWSCVKKALSQDIPNISKLVEVLKICCPNHSNFDLLEALFDVDAFEASYMEDEIESIFCKTLPGMKDLALQLPELVTRPLPYLKGGQSISLTQMQVACILANAFFCTFPPRSRYKDQLPEINFTGLFKMPRGDRSHVECNMEKLKCFFLYFRRVLEDKPNGVITYHRTSIADKDFPVWHESEKPINRLHVSKRGTIEKEGKFMLQVDFANKYLGGGVLGQGCVQEEIRFTICPEFIAGCLFSMVMEDSDAIVICGAEQYCTYSGYGTSFQWGSNFEDDIERDKSGRRCTSLVAIDAIPLYGDRKRQYSLKFIDRELNKAYAGFFRDENCDAIPVASGNWGCGVFGGDPRLKSVLQLLAASQCGRDLVYFTFRDKSLVQQLTEVHLLLMEKKASVGEVYRTILEFKSSNENRDVLAFLKKAFEKSRSIKNFVKSASKPTSPKKVDPTPGDANADTCEKKPDIDFDLAGPSTIIDIPPSPTPSEENCQPVGEKIESKAAAEDKPELEVKPLKVHLKKKKNSKLTQTKLSYYFEKK